MINDNHEELEIRQMRREKRLKKRRKQMKKHGGSLFMIYQNVTLKRLKRKQGGK